TVCSDFSMTGVGLELPEGALVAVGDKVQVGLWRGNTECTFPATIMLHRGQSATGLQFDPMTREQQIDLVQCTFARPDTWQQWNETHDEDRPLRGLQEIAQLGVLGYQKFWHSLASAATSRWLRGRERTSQKLSV
ncbi:MAG: PilZ domain-containing protein, partial [Burkholderiaceae bacterium]|nr:PilZ domain-containing protein [Burkholderiaceae bacterium]